MLVDRLGRGILDYATSSSRCSTASKAVVPADGIAEITPPRRTRRHSAYEGASFDAAFLDGRGVHAWAARGSPLASSLDRGRLFGPDVRHGARPSDDVALRVVDAVLAQQLERALVGHEHGDG